MTSRQVPATTHTSLAEILGGIRMAESGSLQGNYKKRSWYSGQEYYGAYGMPVEQWSPWAALAGMQNAPMDDMGAQDRVAATVLAEYYNQYGSWDLAIIAWFAGPEQTNKLLASGGIGALGERSPVSEQYLAAVKSGAYEAQQNPQYNKPIHTDNLNLTSPGSGWINPVAGESEWSRGSYMPDTHNHRGRTHGAIDVYAAEGTPIVSPVAGRITSTKPNSKGGNTVTIMGDDGIKYYFAHMASESPRTEGERIKAGTHVGYVGNTGSAKRTSPHLHMSMRYKGKVVNPATYLEGAAAMGYSERAINAERAIAQLENPSNTKNQSMMTGWLQGLSNSMAGGNPQLPPLLAERQEVEGVGDSPTPAPATADTSVVEPTLDESPSVTQTKRPGIDGINY